MKKFVDWLEQAEEEGKYRFFFLLDTYILQAKEKTELPLM